MNYYLRMLTVCNSISILLLEQDVPKDTLGVVLSNLVDERPIEALELLCRHKKAALFSVEKNVLAKVEEELALTIISHAQSIVELQRVYKAAELSDENKMVLWARAAGLKYQAPIPIKED